MILIGQIAKALGSGPWACVLVASAAKCFHTRAPGAQRVAPWAYKIEAGAGVEALMPLDGPYREIADGPGVIGDEPSTRLQSGGIGDTEEFKYNSTFS